MLREGQKSAHVIQSRKGVTAATPSEGKEGPLILYVTVCDGMCGYQRLLDRIDLDNCIVTRAELRFGCSQHPIYVLVGVLRDLSG
jgi:hypothetical protein